MTYGYWGKALRVNLTTGGITTETLDDLFLRRYMGGWGFVAHHLLKELAPGIDPLGPDNKLIFATGPVTGQPIACGGRHVVGAKSPLTGGFGAAECGGFFGAELKRAGWDMVIVEGASPTPVYLWIKDGQVALRSAEHLWGQETYDVQAQIREELGDKAIRVAQIGPAGENLVLLSNIMHDATRAAGRTGLGAVMGSKRLRAVAVRGTQHPPAADPEKLGELARWFRENFLNTGSAIFSTLATMRLIRLNNTAGGLPTRNFQEGVFAGFEKLSAETQLSTYTVGRDTCYACPIRCKWIVEVNDGEYRVDPKYGGPEYETVCAFGPGCGVDDLRAVNLAGQMCNASGLDTIGTGVTISFAMECFERGLIGSKDTGGIELRFGNAAAMLEMIGRIARREGFGNVLAEGSRRAAEQIGKGAAAYAIQQKGQEVAMHDPRVKYGHGLGVAVSPTGADHMNSVHDSGYASRGGIAELEPLGIIEPLPFDDLSTGKVRMVRYAMMARVLHNVLCTCMFQAWTPQQRSDMVAAATGWNTSFMELWLAGERIYDMARAFNAREGLAAADDRIHPRFTSPLPEGPVAGRAPTEEQYRKATVKFYELMGWDPATAVPTRAKLEDLDVGWVADLLEAETQMPAAPKK
jgi:aldehyde:ferredoxin oxidoreductase